MENSDSGVSSTVDQTTMISSFLEIAVDQTDVSATQFLEATGWNLEEAIQLFYSGHEFDNSSSSSSYIPSPDREVFMPDRKLEFGGSLRIDEEFSCPWRADQSSTATETSRDNLASLYCPPFALLYHGSFEQAKKAAEGQDRWLLVNLQSKGEFNSHLLNRDTWGNELVAETITASFIFWQVCDDTEEGRKISTFYKLGSVPATLVIDPITGQKMRLWSGMIQPESLLEDVIQFMDKSPQDHLYSSSHKGPRESSHASSPKIHQDKVNEDDNKMKLEQALSTVTLKDTSEGLLKDLGTNKKVPKEEKRNYPTLPEEPKGDKSLLCRVCVRLPDGSRAQRNFLRADPIQLLWSFCAAKCGDEKSFRLIHAIPGAVKDLDYDSLLTFDDSGVANSMISVTWE